MPDFKALIQLISNAVDQFNAQIPSIQRSMLDDVLLLTKKLDADGDTIKVTAANLKILSQVKSKLQNIILNDDYINSTKDFVGNYDDVVKLQNNYFSAIEDKFKPPKLATAIRKEAISSVVNNLTENGIAANVTDKVYDLLRQATTSGGSYSTMNKQLTDFLINNDSGEGQLLKYTKQITTDSLNQFSGTYTQIISSDLDFEWFRYSGTNIETSRPFCLACTDRKYFHISELPKVLRGQFNEFRKYDGKINSKTELPSGMIPGTDVSNFMVNRGGYNCGHQWRPVSDDLVPDEHKARVYASQEYKDWARASGKQIKEAPLVQNPPTQTLQQPEPGKINLSAEPQIKNIFDVKAVLQKNQDAIKDWFNNTSFKNLGVIHGRDLNGGTDMNGTIFLSSEKARLFSEALNNIQNATELSLEQEMAVSTFWHEIWHNRNQSNNEVLTSTERNYMELGNEFVARNTLDDFYEKLGTVLTHDSLKTNRTDTGYNTWVRNYQHLIEFFDGDFNQVLSYMKDKMQNGNYTDVKTYLVTAIMNAGKNLNESDVQKGVRDALNFDEEDFNDFYSL